MLDSLSEFPHLAKILLLPGAGRFLFFPGNLLLVVCTSYFILIKTFVESQNGLVWMGPPFPACYCGGIRLPRAPSVWHGAL